MIIVYVHDISRDEVRYYTTYEEPVQRGFDCSIRGLEGFTPRGPGDTRSPAYRTGLVGVVHPLPNVTYHQTTWEYIE